jgi:hypothetical protein
MIKKLISGGQRGADQAGLAVGVDLGIETGGTAPLGYRTKNGDNPKLAKLGLVESPTRNYATRTFDNAKDSDGTMRFAYNFFSAGEVLTLKAIRQYKKPFFDVNLADIENKEVFIFDVLDWFKENNIEVLNVAGNAGETQEEASKIFKLVRDMLSHFIKKYNEGY